MNAVLQLIVNGLLDYLEQNPDQVKLLVAELAAFLATEIQKALAAAKASQTSTPAAPAIAQTRPFPPPIPVGD